MKKLLGILVLGLLWCNVSVAEKYLDAYTLDKKKIENEVINAVSEKGQKLLKKYKNWEGNVENYKVLKSGITFFSAKELERQRNKNPKNFSKNCFYTRSILDLQPTLEIKGHMWKPGGHYLSQANYTAEYNQTMNYGVQNWLKKGKKDSLNEIKKLLLNWANGRSFSHLYPDTDRQGGMEWGYVDTFWNLRATITNIIIAYAVLSELEIFTQKEKKIVHDWLEFLVAASASQGPYDGTTSSISAGSHTELQRHFVYTLWGVVDENDKYFQAGIKGFLISLARTRKDGSHKYEVRNVKDNSKRHQRGLSKMNQVVGFMVMIAEVAKLQGYDLYSIETKKKVNLHKMIEFLSRGWSDKNIKLSYLISKNQKINFAYKLAGNNASIAWAIPYLANNFQTNGHKIITKWLASLSSDRKNYINDFGFGGSQACYYAASIDIN